MELINKLSDKEYQAILDSQKEYIIEEKERKIDDKIVKIQYVTKEALGSAF